MTAFWNIALRNLAEVDRRFRYAWYLHYHRADEEGSTHLWNVPLLQRYYTALYPRRLSSYYLLKININVIYSYILFSIYQVDVFYEVPDTCCPQCLTCLILLTKYLL
jgi:hypothetical protein